MLNQVVLVGRLTRDISVNKSDKGSKVATITLAVPRSFKNMEGNYDTDFIDCVAFDMIAENTKEYCSKGDIIGVKGRIQSKLVEKDGKKENVLELIAEKVTFLSSKKDIDVEEETGEQSVSFIIKLFLCYTYVREGVYMDKEKYVVEIKKLK